MGIRYGQRTKKGMGNESKAGYVVHRVKNVVKGKTERRSHNHTAVQHNCKVVLEMLLSTKWSPKANPRRFWPGRDGVGS